LSSSSAVRNLFFIKPDIDSEGVLLWNYRVLDNAPGSFQTASVFPAEGEINCLAAVVAAKD